MKISKNTSLLFIISGIILTVIFFFITIFLAGDYFEKKSFTDNAEEITAVCTECFTHTDDSGIKEYFISVEYDRNSQTLTAEDIVTNRKYKAGETVTLYISPTNPTDIKLSLPESRFNFVTIAVMSPFAVLGILLIAVGIKTSRQKRGDA